MITFTTDTDNVNEFCSRLIIQIIDANKDLDLRELADTISSELTSGDSKKILRVFNIMISINHATLHGLGTEYHTDRDGGWGFAKRDDDFLSSLRHSYMLNRYPLSKKQIEALGRCLNKPFYTLQVALVRHTAEPVAKLIAPATTPVEDANVPF